MRTDSSQPRTWRRIDAVFEAALDLPTAERPAYLDRVCASDPALRAKVDRLLAADRQAETFLRTPLGDARRVVPGIGPPRVGPYRLLREIGRGGMGTVYLAVRDDDNYRRLVAIKLMRYGDRDAGMMERFLRERQILADLEHPNIARLYDGGTTDDGRPFFAMEHVAGLPIDVYCEREKLSIRRRLELFIEVCSAVQRAHRSLLVHRDLKPSNILVTATGRPVLLDFGIAKALSPRAEGAGSATSTGQRPMTPRYASPEQIRRQPITTASDVYSLGVLLFELLTGRHPYATASDLPHELERAACEQEPIRPSAAAGAGQARGSGPWPFRRSPLHADLDAIVLKALRKEPADRYSSVEQMADDIRRHLDARPVLARRGSRSYRAGKFIRRRRLLVTAATAVLALSIAFTATATMQARRLDRQRAIAEDDRREAALQRDKAHLALEFLVEVFQVAEPAQAQGEVISARQILDAGARRVRQLADPPDVRATLMDAIGRAYLSLGDSERAAPLLEQAFELRSLVLGPEHADVASSLSSLGELRADQGMYEEADTHYRQALAIQRRTLGADDPRTAETLGGLAAVATRLSRFDEAEARAKEALRILVQAHGADSPKVAQGLDDLSSALGHQGQLEEAVHLQRQALELRRRVLPPRHPKMVANLANVGILLNRAGQYPEAEALTREAIEKARPVFGADHPQTLTILHNLGDILHARGDLEAAELTYREALAGRRASLGADHPVVAVTLGNLALALNDLGRLDEARDLYRQSLSIRRAAFGDRHQAVANSLCGLASVDRQTGALARAERAQRECLEIVLELRGEDNPIVSHALAGLGQILVERDRAEEALGIWRRVLEIREATFPAGHPRIAEAQRGIGRCLTQLRRFAEAELMLVESHRLMATRLGADHPKVAAGQRDLAELYDAWGRPEKATVDHPPND